MKDRTAEIERCAALIWDYHHLHHTLEKADCILALGSHDLRVAERAAELYLQGYAPLLVCSGGLGRLTEGCWDLPEGQRFAQVARELGVPEAAILIEDKSTNTGENLQLTRALLAKHGLDPERFIVVQKPYMERRAYATFKVWLPEKTLMVTSPQLSLKDYPNDEIPFDLLVHIMVGDLQRLREYPAKGFMIPQEIPDEVWAAYEWLVAQGYTDHLIAA